MTALAGAVAFLWSKLERDGDPKPPAVAAATTAPSQTAQTKGAGHAVNAAGGAVVSIGGPASSAPAAPAATSAPVNQSATADDGHAVNAKDSAAVQIK